MNQTHRKLNFAFLSTLTTLSVCSLVLLQEKTVQADTVTPAAAAQSSQVVTTDATTAQSAALKTSAAADTATTSASAASTSVASTATPSQATSTTSSTATSAASSSAMTASTVTSTASAATSTAVTTATSTATSADATSTVTSTASAATSTATSVASAAAQSTSRAASTSATPVSAAAVKKTRAVYAQATKATVSHTGFYTDGQNQTYYYNDQGQTVRNLQHIGSYWYLFNNQSGVMEKGFHQVTFNTKLQTSYFNQYGHMVHAQQHIGKYWYLFNANTGAMATGFHTVRNMNGNQKLNTMRKVYYHKNTGRMVHAQQHIGKYWYLFNAKTGNMATGFHTVRNIDGNQKLNTMRKVYYNKKTGRMVHAQQHIGKYWYLFNAKTGNMATGFHTVRNMEGNRKLDSMRRVYYNTKTGRMVHAQQHIGKYWYLFSTKNGAMSTGFHTVRNVDGNKKLDTMRKVYYNKKTGRMVHAQHHIGKYWYLFNAKTGAVSTGFHTVRNMEGSRKLNTMRTVYCNAAGHMIFGWHQLSRHMYYFNKKTGARLTGTHRIGSRTYSFKKNGVLNAFTDRVISWFTKRRGTITYSMLGSRNGRDGTADCSGSMTAALRAAGAGAVNAQAASWGGYNTVSIRPWLTSNGYYNVTNGHSWNAKNYSPKYGDIVIWGDLTGGAGHIMIVSKGSGNKASVISTCGWNNDAYHQAIQEFNYNWYYGYDNGPSYHVYRLHDALRA